MNFKIKSIYKPIVLSLFWLIFPPLFLVFSIIWKTPKFVHRIVLTAFAPLTIVAFVIGIFGLQQLHYFYIERGSSNEIEAKIGLKFPDYKTVENRHFTYGPSFNGDFTMERLVKLDTVNIQVFYKQIEQEIDNATQKKDSTYEMYWSKTQDGNYSFSRFNDPQDEDDQTMELKIDKPKSLVRITYGRM